MGRPIEDVFWRGVGWLLELGNHAHFFRTGAFRCLVGSPRKPVVLSNCPIDLGVFRVDLYVDGLQGRSFSQEFWNCSPRSPVRRFSARWAIKSMSYTIL